MSPIDTLMTEHRLIERMIHLIKQELERITANVAVDPEFAFVEPEFITIAADFLQTYAERCHFGKEETLLFTAADKWPAPHPPARLQALTAEHGDLRQLSAQLLAAHRDYSRRMSGALTRLLDSMAALVDQYPRHFAQEEEHLFASWRDSLSAAEKDTLRQQMAAFDRTLIHEKYTAVVEKLETRRSCAL